MKQLIYSFFLLVLISCAEDHIGQTVSGDIIIIDQDYKYKANPIEINKEITINLGKH